MHPRCTHSHRSWSRRCTQNTHQMHLGCTREASQMHNECTHRIPGAFKTDTTLHAVTCTLDAPSMHPFPQIVEHAPPNSIHTTCALDAHHMPTRHTPRRHQIDTKSLRDPKFTANKKVPVLGFFRGKCNFSSFSSRLPALLSPHGKKLSPS